MNFDLRLAIAAISATALLFLAIAFILRITKKRSPAAKINKTPPPPPPRPIGLPKEETTVSIPAATPDPIPDPILAASNSVPVAPKAPAPPRPSYGAAEKRRAKRAIEMTFKGFFFTYLGNKSFKGIVNHPGNLEPGKSHIFRESRLEEIGKFSIEAKAKLVFEIKKEASILEDKKVEAALHELCQKLVEITDLFTISEKTQKETLQTVYDILKNPAKE